ncbi:MAG: DKNYY domain-containing protein [Patescibacteria group bacterium]
MKKYIYIVVALILLSIIAISVFYYYKEVDLGYGYIKKGGKVYYSFQSAVLLDAFIYGENQPKEITELLSKKKLLPNADISTFEVLKTGDNPEEIVFAKDAHSVYLLGFKLEGLDSESFSLIIDSKSLNSLTTKLFKDKNGVYLIFSNEYDGQRLTKFEQSEETDFDPNFLVNHYIKLLSTDWHVVPNSSADSRIVFGFNPKDLPLYNQIVIKKLPIKDPQSVKIVNAESDSRWYLTDNNGVYLLSRKKWRNEIDVYPVHILENFSPNGFSLVETNKTLDKVYYGHHVRNVDGDFFIVYKYDPDDLTALSYSLTKLNENGDAKETSQFYSKKNDNPSELNAFGQDEYMTVDSLDSCSGMKGEVLEACMLLYVRKTKDINTCNKINITNYKADCYAEIALDKESPLVCNAPEINNDVVSESCLGIFYQKRPDLNLSCDLFKSLINRNGCFEDSAQYRGDINLCDNIKNETWSLRCKQQVIPQEVRPNICAGLPEPKRSNCYSYTTRFFPDVSSCGLLAAKESYLCQNIRYGHSRNSYFDADLGKTGTFLSKMPGIFTNEIVSKLIKGDMSERLPLFAASVMRPVLNSEKYSGFEIGGVVVSSRAKGLTFESLIDEHKKQEGAKNCLFSDFNVGSIRYIKIDCHNMEKVKDKDSNLHRIFYETLTDNTQFVAQYKISDSWLDIWKKEEPDLTEEKLAKEFEDLIKSIKFR